MENLDLEKLNTEMETWPAINILKWCFENFENDKIVFSNGFGCEGMCIHHMLTLVADKPHIFTLDTGRMFQESYNVWHEAVKKYGVPVKAYYPDESDIQKLYEQGGPNLFYESVDFRKSCCDARKVKPLKSALEGADIWITALRRDQGDSRKNLKPLAFSSKQNIYKLHPVFNWSEDNVWEYIRNNDVPYNKLHDEGFSSIGCAPCTRGTKRIEDIRAGRWWWESKEQKECGLHIEDGKVIPKKPLNWNI